MIPNYLPGTRFRVRCSPLASLKMDNISFTSTENPIELVETRITRITRRRLKSTYPSLYIYINDMSEEVPVDTIYFSHHEMTHDSLRVWILRLWNLGCILPADHWALAISTHHSGRWWRWKTQRFDLFFGICWVAGSKRGHWRKGWWLIGMYYFVLLCFLNEEGGHIFASTKIVLRI